MKVHHFMLATVSFSSTAAVEKTLNLRGIAANNLSILDTSPPSSGTSPNYQQTSDKPQCALDVASLNRGDVQIELPGKVGFETFPNCTTLFSAEFLDELGVDKSTCIMSMPQLTKAGFAISRFAEYMPKEALDLALKGRLTTGRAGMLTCDVSTGESFSKAYSLKAWRPYKMTEGWHYFTLTDCNDDGWVGFGLGRDGTVDIDLKYKGKLGYASQNSRGGSEFISIVSPSYNIGNVGEEATKACCSPEPGVAWDCSAVHAMIDSFDLSSVDRDS